MKIVKNGIVRDVQNHELYINKGWKVLDNTKSPEGANKPKKLEDMKKSELKEVCESKNIQIENFENTKKEDIVLIIKAAEESK